MLIKVIRVGRVDTISVVRISFSRVDSLFSCSYIYLHASVPQINLFHFGMHTNRLILLAWCNLFHSTLLNQNYQHLLDVMAKQIALLDIRKIIIYTCCALLFCCNVILLRFCHGMFVVTAIFFKLRKSNFFSLRFNNSARLKYLIFIN